MHHLRAILGIVPSSPLRVFMLGYYTLIGLSLGLAAGLYVAGVDRFWALIVLLPLATAPVVVPIVALISRSYMVGLQRLQAGEYWARWHYAPEEWQRFTDAEWSRTRREALRGPLYALLLAGIIGVVFGLLGQSLLAGLAIGGIVFAAGLLTSAGIWLAGRWRYRQRDAGSGEILIGPDGVFSSGRYIAFRAFNLQLSRVDVEPGDPASLLIVTDTRNEYGATTSSETRLPIPARHVAEAEALAARVRRLHSVT